MVHTKSHARSAMLYFLLASVVGVVLRSFHSVEIPFNYKFFVHTHSHIALLGWVYVGLTTLLYKLFVQSPVVDKKYRKIFWFTQFTLLGMLFTFPFQGYALFSIIFSTLFLFASYWFFWFFGIHAKREFKKRNSYRCIKAALWFMVFSSIGPWALGFIMNTLGPQSVWYRLSIYFYLHFQYNGWMILALFGLFLYILEQNQLTLSDKTFKKFYWSIILGILLSFFLSTLFAHPPMIINVLGGIGGLLQLAAFGVLLKIFVELSKKSSIGFSSFQRGLLKTFALFMVVKMLLQLVTAIPYFANLAATLLDFTVGYLHWTFLGVVTIGLFLFLDYFKLVHIPKKAYAIYLIGFFVTEALIFYKGIAAWQSFSPFQSYFEVLAAGSFLIPLSLIFMLIANLLNKKAE